MIKTFCLALSLLFTPFISVASQFDTLVVLGDSLSDNGNLYRYFAHVLPKSPPYFTGHFSNGPVWAEYLYSAYFQGWTPEQLPYTHPDNYQDFAVGGAGATIAKKENLPYTLTSEVEDYLYLHNFHKKDTSLYTIWVGANNYLNGPSNVDEISSHVVNSIGDNIETLINHGATQFLVINLPDLGRTPEASVNHTQNLLTELSTTHNAKLLERYNALQKQYPNVTFAYLDVYTLFNQLINTPQQFDINNTTTPCYGGGYASLIHQTALSTQEDLQNYLTQQETNNKLKLSPVLKQNILQNPVLKEALSVGYQSNKHPFSATSEAYQCTGILFWDHVHPTTAIHKIISQYAKQTLDSIGIVPIQSN